MQRRSFIKHTGAAGLIFFASPIESFESAKETDISSLEQNFLHPPSSAHPLVYWIWMNGNVTKDGITLDLEAMKRIGVAGVFNYDVGVGIPKGPVQYLSDEWLELIKHAIKEAARLGLEYTMHNCPGWSASGGPWITPELAMQQITWSESYVAGGGNINQQLPLPASRFGHYHDVTVIAYPSMEGEELLQDVRVTSGRGAINRDQLSGNNPDGVIVYLGDNQRAWLQFEFSQPYQARAISFFISAIPVEGAPVKPLDFGDRTSVDLEFSNDGIQFSKIVSINTGLDTELLLNSKYITFDFPATRAKFFRIVSNAPRKYRQVQFSSFVRLKNWMEKTNTRGRNNVFVEDASTIETTNTQIVAPGFIIDETRIVDLSSFMDKAGLLRWSAPAGNWTILRIGFTPSGTLNKAAPDTGIGLECDKYNQDAISFHFKKMTERLLPFAKANRLKFGIALDSYEAGGQNWTAGLEEKFEAKWRYDIKKYLPVLTGGRIIGSVDHTERFLWDLRRLHADLMAQNYYGTFAKLCRDNDLKSYIEPYESGPMEEMQIGSKGDVVMGEFWSSFSFATPTKPTALRTSRLAATIAHVNNKKVAGAEAFTAEAEASRWQEYPFYLKAVGDKAFTSGINRFMIHRFAHQPHPTAAPGMTMGPWGIHFDRTNTLWNHFKEWMTYLARCQYMLQQGKFVADLLYFSGDDANMFTKVLKEDLHPTPPMGYDYDLVNADIIINQMRISNNRIMLSNGMQYRIFVLQDYKAIPLELLKRIYQLVLDGMIMVGNRPDRCANLNDAQNDDSGFRNITSQLWGEGETVDRTVGKGHVYWGSSFDFILRKLEIRRDFEFSSYSGDARILYTHRKVGETHIYFLSNQKRSTENVVCWFRVHKKVPEIWDPATGMRMTPLIYEMNDDNVQIPIQFEPDGSLFVLFPAFESLALPSILDAIEQDGVEVINANYSTQEDESIRGATGTFTIAFWAKPDIDVLLNPKFILGTISEPWTDFYAIYPYNGNKLFGHAHACCGIAVGRNGVAIWENADGVPQLVLPAETPVSSWTHIVLRYDNNVPSVFLNGRQSAEGNKSAYVVHTIQPALELPDDASPYNGDMTQPTIFNEALSEERIKLLANEKFYSSGKQLPVTFSFDKRATVFIHASGNYRFKKKNAVVLSRKIELSTTIDLNDDWFVKFPQGLGAPGEIRLPKLISLHLHSDPGVKYFSGTATYSKNFMLPNNSLTANQHWFLDLGEVAVIANVSINEKSFGNLWKRPYRIDITSALRERNNILEIQVANQWVNRLIGDEQFPDPDKFTPGGGSSGLESLTKGGIEILPSWYTEGKPKPHNDRVTFATWKNFRKDSPLIQSGLVGPVTLNAALRLTISV